MQATNLCHPHPLRPLPDPSSSYNIVDWRVLYVQELFSLSLLIGLSFDSFFLWWDSSFWSSDGLFVTVFYSMYCIGVHCWEILAYFMDNHANTMGRPAWLVHKHPRYSSSHLALHICSHHSHPEWSIGDSFFWFWDATLSYLALILIQFGGCGLTGLLCCVTFWYPWCLNLNDSSASWLVVISVGGAVSLLWCIPSCLAYRGRLAQSCWLFLRVDLWSILLKSDDLASFESDILELMGDVLPSTRCSWDWTSLLNDDSLVFLCSPPPPPPVPIRWITWMNTFLHPSALDSALTPVINYVAISHPVLLQWCSLPVNYVPGPIGWRTHCLLCRLTLWHEQAFGSPSCFLFPQSSCVNIHGYFSSFSQGSVPCFFQSCKCQHAVASIGTNGQSPSLPFCAPQPCFC